MPRKATFRVALLWSFVMNGGKKSILLLLTFVLAALVGPQAFGTVAMAAAYVLIAEMVLDLGLGATLVQREDLRDEHLDAAFWTLVAWSLVLLGASLAVAPWWAGLNDLPELEAVIGALALLLPIQGLALVQRALFERDLDFRSLAIRSNASAFTAGVVSLTAAFLGAGVWALVLQRLTMAAVGLVLLWWISPWRPRLRFDAGAARELVGFSSGALLGRVAVFATSRADALIMGVFFGPLAVGIYQLGYRLMGYIVDLASRSIQTVAMADFSTFQSQPDALRRAVARCLRVSASLAMPPLAILAVSSGDLVALLGDEWLPAAVPTAVLCVVGAVRASGIVTGPILRAMGRPFVHASLMWLLAVPTVLTIVAVSVLMGAAAPAEQATAIAASRVALFALVSFPLSVVVVRRVLPRAPLLRPLWPAATASAAGAGTVLGLQALGLLPRSPALLALAVEGTLATLLVYGVLLALDPDLRSRLLERLGRPGAAAGLSGAMAPAAGDERSDG